jgi:uncharacterized membrane protein
MVRGKKKMNEAKNNEIKNNQIEFGNKLSKATPIWQKIELPTLSTAVIWFSLQFVLALILHLVDVSKGRYGQPYTGITMGWVCLIYGFKYASLISQNISKRASYIYRSSGVVLLFISNLPFGWILALIHQVYTFKHGQNAKEYTKFIAIIITLMIAIYFGGSLLYELLNQK